MEILVIDSETSGLVSSGLIRLDKQPEAIEFCAATIDIDHNIEVVFDHLIRPKFPVSAEITGITGITQQDVDGAEPFMFHAARIRELIENAPCVVAHNASFDVEVVNMEFKRLGQTLKWPRLCCTVEQTVALKGYRLNLGDLHELLFGERFPEAHRARNDVLALARCVVELEKRGEL